MNPPTVTQFCEKCQDYTAHYLSPSANIGVCDRCLTPWKIKLPHMQSESIHRQEKRV